MITLFMFTIFSGVLVNGSPLGTSSCGLTKTVNNISDLISLMPASSNMIGSFQKVDSSDFFLITFSDQVQYIDITINVDMLDETGNPITDCSNLNVNYNNDCIPQLSIPENCYASKTSNAIGTINIKFNLKYIIKSGSLKVSQIMSQMIIVQVVQEFTNNASVNSDNIYTALTANTDTDKKTLTSMSNATFSNSRFGSFVAFFMLILILL